MIWTLVIPASRMLCAGRDQTLDRGGDLSNDLPHTYDF